MYIPADEQLTFMGFVKTNTETVQDQYVKRLAEGIEIFYTGNYGNPIWQLKVWGNYAEFFPDFVGQIQVIITSFTKK